MNKMFDLLTYYPTRIREELRSWILPQYQTTMPPQIICLTGMPRNGTTMAKRFLGTHPAIDFPPASFMTSKIPLNNFAQDNRIYLEKSTRHLPRIKRLYYHYGNIVWFVIIMRDPRDALLSLLETDIHQEIPRDQTYWEAWYNRYMEAFNFANQYNKRGVKVAFMRYEDLVNNPQIIKHKFLDWLGLPISHLDPEYEPVPEIGLGPNRGEDWKTHQTNKVHTNSLERHKSVTDAHIVKLINGYKQIGHIDLLMTQCGYGDSTSAISLSLGPINIFTV